MKTWIVAGACALTLAGCSMAPTDPLKDGYQFGDLSLMQAQYCATAEPRQRAILLALMYRAGVELPPSGACSEILTVLPETALEIDVEQAEADRARFEELIRESTDPLPAADLQGP